ncbi:hypothetical protein JCM15548_14164 [Geofilum rubicundum JCM 15548]|uniref:Uncharacterized protein n=1 Tax=Geofilum rubicundum JCM 15548 TaxID=1236989 RepID=A0A0E9M2Z0_9BACT|nr:hypothetical protein JCM15548_14164 [Geofilum rubicundum JCM 15548]
MFKKRNIKETWIKHFSLHVLHPRDRYLLLLAAMLLLFLSWSGFLSFLDRPVSFLNLLYIHGFFPVWILDLLIMSVPLAILAFLNKVEQKTARANQNMAELNARISKNIDLANA